MSALGRLCSLVIGLAAVGLAGCGSDASVLATVGERQLEIIPCQAYIGDVTGETWEAVSAVVASRLLDQYIDRFVVLESALEKDVHTPSTSASLGPNEVRWLLEELCGHPSEPAAATIAAEVDRQLEETKPAQAHVRQVLVDNYEEALAARERLVAGEDFVVISRELSKAPNAADGGELGFFEQGSLTPEVDEVIFALEMGEFSDPVQGPSGFHVFQVLEVIPAGPPDRLVVGAEVRSRLVQEAGRVHTRECVESMADAVGVEIKEINLWFPYSGKYAEDASNG